MGKAIYRLKHHNYLNNCYNNYFLRGIKGSMCLQNMEIMTLQDFIL